MPDMTRIAYEINDVTGFANGDLWENAEQIRDYFRVENLHKDRTQYRIEDYLFEAQYPHHTGPDTYVYIDDNDKVVVMEKLDRAGVPCDEHEAIGYVWRFILIEQPHGR